MFTKFGKKYEYVFSDLQKKLAIAIMNITEFAKIYEHWVMIIAMFKTS